MITTQTLTGAVREFRDCNRKDALGVLARAGLAGPDAGALVARAYHCGSASGPHAGIGRTSPRGTLPGTYAVTVVSTWAGDGEAERS